MIISRTPFRISFFGGGTDYPIWYRENGGVVLNTTIDKYCYISCRYLPPFFEYKYRIRYSLREEKCSINEVQTVGFHVSWEHDSTDVIDARVYVNGTEYITNGTGWMSFSIAYDSVGKRSWDITDLQHQEATSYRMTAESPYIVWDEVVFDVQVDASTFGVSKVRVSVSQAYNGASVTGATAYVNGKLCEEIEAGVYETKIDSWSPYQQVTVQVDTAELSGETWTTSTFHILNVTLYIGLFVAVIVVVVLILKLRNRTSNQPLETTDENNFLP